MAALEKRILDLEAQTASTDKSVKVFFCNVGEEPAHARARAGIPLDYAGKVVCVEFVDAPNALKESQHDKE
jgi:hypothetical protein